MSPRMIAFGARFAVLLVAALFTSLAPGAAHAQTALARESARCASKSLVSSHPLRVAVLTAILPGC